MAVVGFNGRGLNHIAGWLSNPGAELVAWCDCDPGVEERALKKFPKMSRQPRFVQDFRRLLEDPSIDVISIATPNHWHALMVIWAMQAGPVGVANIWWGTEGYVVTPNYSSGMAFDYDGKELASWKGGSDQLHYDNFVDAVLSRDRATPHLDIEEGHISSAMANLGNVSWGLGEKASLGTRPRLAADEQHVAEANRLFTREYRTGFELPRV